MSLSGLHVRHGQHPGYVLMIPPQLKQPIESYGWPVNHTRRISDVFMHAQYQYTHQQFMIRPYIIGMVQQIPVIPSQLTNIPKQITLGNPTHVSSSHQIEQEIAPFRSCQQDNHFDEVMDHESRCRRLATMRDITAWARRVDEKIHVHVTGSYMLGNPIKSSDLDLIMIGPFDMTESKFMSDMYNVLVDFGVVPRTRTADKICVMSVMHPLTHMKIDILYVSRASLYHSAVRNQLQLTQNTPGAPSLTDHNNTGALGVLSSYRCNSFIKHAMKDSAEFVPLSKSVKIWAKGNRLYGNIGAIPGIGWTIMVCYFLQYRTSIYRHPASFLEFCSFYETWDCRQAIILAPAQPITDLRNSFLNVYMPVFPYSNITSSVKDEIQWNFYQALSQVTCQVGTNIAHMSG